MRFMNLLISLIGLSASTVAFTINSPSASSYWVQFATNTISWSKGSNDTSQVSLQIIHPNATLLNGVFSIAEYVPASLESYTVTNVTLVVADGYMVQMVNPANASVVFASSPPFSVKPNGTAAAAPAAGSPGSTNGMGGNMTGNMGGMVSNVANTTTTRNTSGFNNGTSTKNGANSAGSSLVPVSSAALFVAASAIGLAIV